MDLGALLIGFALLVLCIPFVARPFLKGSQWSFAGARENTDSKVGNNQKAQRQQILSAVSDLDFDFQTGKVTEEDHQSLRTQLLVEAASLTQDHLDEDDEIEALIRARREVLEKSAGCEQCGERLGEADQFCPHCGSDHRAAGQPVNSFCPSCGSRTMPEALFCSRCGERLAATQRFVKDRMDDVR